MYAATLIPKNMGLTWRLASEVSAAQVLHQIRRNLATNMYQVGTPQFIVPNAIYIDPTYRCNRSCDGCYVEKDSAIIDPKIPRQASEFALKRGINYIAWLGGEPLLPAVRDLMLNTVAAFPALSFTFCTNSDFLDDKVADQLTKLNNLVPFISVDGLQATHDARRGKDSHASTVSAMRRLKERKRLFGYMTTVMPMNWEEVSSQEFIQTMISRGVMFGGYSLYKCQSQGTRTLDPDQYLEFARRIKQQANAMPIYLLSADFGYLGREKPTNSKRLIAITIGPSGEIKTERGSVTLGTITDKTDLETILTDEKTQKIFREKLLGTGGGERDPRLAVLQEMEESES